MFSMEGQSKMLQNVFLGGKYLEKCLFDDNFREVIEEVKGMEGIEDEKADEYLNYDISLQETEAVLQLLKNKKNPRPDEVYTDLIRMASGEMLKAIHRLFQKSWRDVKAPGRWKEAEVKFLRKQGNKSYHETGSYRPISLSSALCKCLERIITHSLYGFVKHFELLDKQQEGFRRFRGTCDALLRLTQDILRRI